MVDALVAEVAGKNTAVRGETGDGHADVVVNLEDLALMGGEVGGGLVDGGEDDVGGGAKADGGGPLLDGLHGVLHLEQTPRRAPSRHVRVVLVPKHVFGVCLLLFSRSKVQRVESGISPLLVLLAAGGYCFFPKPRLGPAWCIGLVGSEPIQSKPVEVTTHISLSLLFRPFSYFLYY